MDDVLQQYLFIVTKTWENKRITGALFCYEYLSAICIFGNILFSSALMYDFFHDEINIIRVKVYKY